MTNLLLALWLVATVLYRLMRDPMREQSYAAECARCVTTGLVWAMLAGGVLWLWLWMARAL